MKQPTEKMRRKFEDLNLKCATTVAFGTLCLAPFTYGTWPNRTMAAVFVAFEWLCIFGYANGFFTLSDNMDTKGGETDD